MKLRSLLAWLAAASLLVPAAARGEVCPQPPPLRFREPVYIDTERHGGEPVSVVAPDGGIVVAAHRGTTHLYLRTVPEVGWYAGYQNQVYLWRSPDGGRTWQRVEAIPGISVHTVGSNGFSDPDLTRDAAGTLYGVELGLVDVSVFVSRDGGRSWPEAHLLLPQPGQRGTYDRPWIAPGQRPGELYLKLNPGFAKSTDGGRSWEFRTDPGGLAKVLADPSRPGRLYAPAEPGVRLSDDDGWSWTTYDLPGSPSGFGPVGVDAGGWAYTVWAGWRGRLWFAAFDPQARQWRPRVLLRQPPGGSVAFWPWVVAGDEGRVAVGWYEATLVDPGPVPPVGERWQVRVYVAVTTNARGGACPVAFSVADAAGRPIHEGALPCSGLGCNVADVGGDRRLGDFFTINYDAAGRVFVTTGDTMLKGPAGLENQTSRPLFVGADDDSPRLVRP